MGIAERYIVEEHYAHLKNAGFFKDLVDFMTSGPVVKMIIFGEDVVNGVRKLLSATDPKEAAVGTIRSDFAISKDKNICHASDSIESAEREVSLWMKDPMKNFQKA